MAATKYLDYDGLLYFWTLIKGKLALKADAQSVTAGSYGPSADASPAHSGTFKVPYVQVTSQGVVTAISEKTITLPADSDTKNTAGSTDSSSKLFIIGATSQAANPQTYSQDTAYIGTDGCLYSNNTKVATVATTLAGYGITDAYTKTEVDNKLVSAVNYKGSVATYNDLPNNPTVGDMYNVTATDENYIWAGAVGTEGQSGYVAAHWDPIGAIVNLAAITNGEIDTIVAS